MNIRNASVAQYGNPRETTEDTKNRLSGSIWWDCPLDEEPSRGYGDFDTLLTDACIVTNTSYVRNGTYRAYASDGGTVADGALLGGAVVLSSDGDNEGAAFQFATSPYQITQNGKKFWFEVRLKTSTIADTKHGIFVGLLETATLSATVPIAAAGTLADQNFVGFHRLEADGDYFDTVYKANGVTQVSVQTDAVLLVADTYVKLGMKYDPNDDYKLTFYKNGVKLGTTYVVPNATGTDFPADVRMGPAIAVLNATGTTPGTTTVDWWGHYQEAA